MIGLTEALLSNPTLPRELINKVNDILTSSMRLSRVIDNVLKPYEEDSKSLDSEAFSSQAITKVQIPSSTKVASGEDLIAPVDDVYTLVKILIVDDEDLNRRVIRTHLEELDYDLYEARNGQEALRIFESEGHFDLILLDIMMPDMNGYEVARKIRQTSSANHVLIVMLTAKQQVQDLVEGFESGANDYIHKPFSKGELLARIKSHIHLSSINKAMQRFIPLKLSTYLVTIPSHKSV